MRVRFLKRSSGNPFARRVGGTVDGMNIVRAAWIVSAALSVLGGFGQAQTPAPTGRPPAQPAPGRPAGTPGRDPWGIIAEGPNHDDKAAFKLAYAVADFRTRGGDPEVGAQIADAYAATLTSMGATNVVRVPEALNYGELVEKAQPLAERLKVDVIVGGGWTADRRTLTVEMVDGKDGRPLAVEHAESPGGADFWAQETKDQKASAVVESVQGAVFLQKKGADAEEALRVSQVLEIGDRVRCEPDGKVALRIDDRRVTVGPGQGWYTIAAPVKPELRNLLEKLIRGLLIKPRSGFEGPVMARY
jgi:hypothetical protein